MKKLDPAVLIPQAILGAGMSLDYLAVTGAEFVRDGLAEDVAMLADGRLRLRCIVVDPGSPYIPVTEHRPPIDADLQGRAVSQLEEWGWEVRLSHVPPSRNCLIVDEQLAVLSVDSWFVGDRMPAHVTESPASVASFLAHFDRVWDASSADTSRNNQPLYECLLQTSEPKESANLITASQSYWGPIIRKMASNPDLMHTLDDRVFEEFVAELLTRDGLNVQLTQRTRDGGYDILACADTVVGAHLYLVECKRNSPDRPVGVGVVRMINGVLESQRATAAMVVTTSRFTEPAVAFAATTQHRLHLRDFAELQEWIIRHAYA